MSNQKRSIIRIESHKHNGEIHRIWERTFVLKQQKGQIIGANIGTKVIEPLKREFYTTDPAICYFDQQRWFNVIGLIKETGVHYYCNLTNSYTLENGVLIYIDYDLDVIVSPTYEYEIVDEEEYEMNQQFMNYPQEVKKKIEEELQILLQWIKHQKGPFQPGFVMDWYKKFREGSFSF